LIFQTAGYKACRLFFLHKNGSSNLDVLRHAPKTKKDAKKVLTKGEKGGKICKL